LKCIKWLKYHSFKNNIHIQHAKNDGEKNIGDYFSDGYSEQIIDNKIVKTAYEFHRCIWHGCKKCYDMKAWNPARQEMMISTHLRHEKRINYLKKILIDCIFEEIWECEYDDLLQSDNEFKLFIKNCELSELIRPMDALFGGRTNPFKLYHKCNENEEIKYDDFTLCRTCAFEKIKNFYHSNEECQIEGTWISFEVIEAVKNGYKILKISEVWQYEERTKFDKIKKTGGLFTDYVDLILKGKQEACGFPDNVVTEEDKLRYLKD
jgi:hypothetical protein